jgi:hypothetical protein
MAGVLGVWVAAVPPRAEAATDAYGCETSPRKRSPFGKMLGDIAGAVVADQAKGLGLGYRERSTIAQTISGSIACALQPAEREKAEAASTKAVGRPVGTTETWKSETRPDVHGSSTVTAQTVSADGTICKNVRDAATIDGEETIVMKRMCLAPGAPGYVKTEAQA